MSKKISWNQFKVKDLKPNLIENGWDDFKPNGSGKNYIKDSATSQRRYYATETILKGEEIYVIYKGDRTEKGYVAWSDQNNQYAGELWFGASETHIDDVYITKITVRNDIREFRIAGQPKEFYVCKADDPYLYIEKTPLGNGLTRIQTWGGRTFQKLMFRENIKNKSLLSFYVKETNLRFTIAVSKPKWSEKTYGKNFFGMVEFDLEKQDDSTNNLIGIGAYDKNLDFIASDPVIVEGDTPNPVMIVDTLDDGREHVKVYGATPETKLVYDEKGFKGDLYSFSTEIENKGAYLEMESSIGNYREEIPEGTMELRHEGNLSKPQIEFKVGASDE